MLVKPSASLRSFLLPCRVWPSPGFCKKQGCWFRLSLPFPQVIEGPRLQGFSCSSCSPQCLFAATLPQALEEAHSALASPLSFLVLC